MKFKATGLETVLTAITLGCGQHCQFCPKSCGCPFSMLNYADPKTVSDNIRRLSREEQELMINSPCAEAKFLRSFAF